MSKTMENLHTAFAGESQANRRYLFFADKVAKDGHTGIARLFRAAADAETVHARNHFDVIGGMGSTKDSIMTAIMAEEKEFTSMYPGFIEQARAEREERAGDSFTMANKVEKIHHGLFQEAMKALKAGQDLKDEPYFVCQVCGNTVAGEAPEKCPICSAPRSRFKQID